jgi:Domain of unknown function (DUF1906)
MRTAGKITAIIGSGLLLAGAGSVMDAPAAGPPAAVAAMEGPARPRPAASAVTRTVSYAGDEITVPADWPVYRLDADPARCVRYDVHAVYLGTPGTGQRCPAGLIGRTETVSIIPAPAGAQGVMRGDAITHEITVAGPAGGTAGASVVATYGADPALIRQVLGTLRPAPAGTAVTGTQAIGARVLGRRAAAGQATGARDSAPRPAATEWHGLPSSWPTAIVETAPVTPVRPPLPGFDACTAPSLPTMKAWRQAYAVAGIYIGGVNVACDLGNLSAAWIRSAAAMGWSMLPTYVGPQAPCTSYGNLIRPAQAAAEGAAVADDAVRDAIALGLPTGSPIYYDMEGYAGGPSCAAAVLAFLGAWTRQLTIRGYVSGVYSSRDSGIADMQAAAVARQAGFTPPQAVWTALWDGQATLGTGSPPWPLTERSKQYIGPHDMTIGGFTLSIDADLVGGPVLSAGGLSVRVR